MLRAVSNIYLECQVPELLFSSRRVVLKVFRVAAHSSSAPSSQTVLKSPRSAGGSTPSAAADFAPVPPVPPAADGSGGGSQGPGGGSEGPGGRRTTRPWPLAAALALTASLGGVYFFKKREPADPVETLESPSAASKADTQPTPTPALASELPERVEYLIAGGGSAGFAALRSLRAAKPGTRILLVASEGTPPYLRPPLSKEIWREPSALAGEEATFRQWSGRRRNLLLEPREFYAAPSEMKAEKPRAALMALGWRVARVDPDKKVAELRAGDQRATVQYDQCLLAPGSIPRRSPPLRAAAAAGRALPLRSLQDARALARAVDAAGPGAHVAVLGAGLEGCELAAALAANGTKVTLVFKDEHPLSSLLPRHLAQDAARALTAAGVALVPRATVAAAELPATGVTISVEGRTPVRADVVVECVGAKPDVSVARESGLEVDEKTGGIMVDACLRAHAGIYVAGDAASFYWRGGPSVAVTGGAATGGAAAGGVRVTAGHHDHAVRSGRAAAANMAANEPELAYDYQPMFWTDLGPELGFEAVGIVDSSLPTVSVFADDAVTDLTASTDDPIEPVTAVLPAVVAAGNDPAVLPAVVAAGNDPAVLPAVAAAGNDPAVLPAEHSEASPCRYTRGVVFYKDREGGKVVGVLMWNVFNRVTLAQQVVSQGEFDDLVEVAKLFTARERDA